MSAGPEETIASACSASVIRPTAPSLPAGGTRGAIGQEDKTLGRKSGLHLGGVTAGYAIYAGLLRIPMRWFFAATGILVLLLAAGMAAQAARFLIQADILPSLAAPLWDTSAALPERSIAGMLLHCTAWSVTTRGQPACN